MTDPGPADPLAKRLIVGLAVLLGLSLVAEIGVEGHPYFAVAGIFAFPVWFGLGAGLTLLILAAVWEIGRAHV
jgi:hypothetical protein